MSVSLSQGFTSRVTTDYTPVSIHGTHENGDELHTLAIVFGLFAFFALYAATRSALMRSASSSTSSSEPKRSTSSSSSSAGALRNASPALLEPESESCSDAYDLMCAYQRATAGCADASGAAEIALKTWTSACEGVWLFNDSC